MKGQKLSDHGTRDAILDLLEREPGMTMTEIADALDLNKGTLRYHLEVLVKKERIFIRTEGKKRSYYSGKAPARRSRERSRDLSRTDKRILSVIEENPGIDLKGLSRVVNISRSEGRSVLRRLEGMGIIWKVRYEDGVGYEKVTEKMILDRMYIELVQMFMDGSIGEQEFLVLKSRLDRKSGRG